MRIILLILLLSGCAGLHRTIDLLQDTSSRVITPQTPQLYTQAMANFEKEKFAEAKMQFEEFLTAEPTTAYTQIAYFNLARCNFALKMYRESVEKLRFIATQSSGNAPELQAQAFYQLSFSYEALGDKVNALASLFDSYKRKQYFPSEIATAEIPARIAGALAALGNFEQAKVYYTQAEEGVRQLKREFQNRQAPEWLPRTLYYMGEVSLRKISYDDISSVLRPLSKAQIYLLESTEIGQSDWSKKSSEDLIRTYEAACELIAKSKEMKGDGDQITMARRAQEKQWELAQEFYKVLDEMKIYERPDAQNQNTLTKSIFKSVSVSKEKLLKILAQPKVGQEITESAKEHKRSVKRKVMNPDSVLEKEYLRAQTSKKKTEEAPPKDETDSKDPNL